MEPLAGRGINTYNFVPCALLVAPLRVSPFRGGTLFTGGCSIWYGWVRGGAGIYGDERSSRVAPPPVELLHGYYSR